MQLSDLSAPIASCEGTVARQALVGESGRIGSVPCLEILHADGIRAVAVYFLEHVPENLNLAGNDMRSAFRHCQAQREALKFAVHSISERSTNCSSQSKFRAAMPALLAYASASSQRCLCLLRHFRLPQPPGWHFNCSGFLRTLWECWFATPVVLHKVIKDSIHMLHVFSTRTLARSNKGRD